MNKQYFYKKNMVANVLLYYDITNKKMCYGAIFTGFNKQ